MALTRSKVNPFTDRQIALVTNFAAQAVIAIENARLLSELRQRTDDLTESLEQQTATSEVLKVISSSGAELQLIFETLLANATRLCGAKFGNLHLAEGDGFRAVAMHNVPAAFAEVRKGEPAVYRPERGGLLYRLAQTKAPVIITDAMSEPGYVDRSNKRLVSAVDLGGFRSNLAVPMLKDETLIGGIIIYRQEPGDFSHKQIELMRSFAAQAVIAIENARLLNELRELLEQQTATTEVLKVISASPGDLKPVFAAILENATRICEAQFGNLALREAEGLRMVAMHNAPPAYAEARQREPLQRPSPLRPIARAVATKQLVHVTDYAEELVYKQREPGAVMLVELAKVRSLIVMPMLKDGEVVGALTIYRQEVRPFTEKQIAVVQNFANQAVIAIENTRLLNELRESLQQQTATADVLKVISSSPGELKPVFQAMLENATRICEAESGTLALREGDAFRLVALLGASAAFSEERLRQPMIRLSPGHHLIRLVETKKVVHITDLLADQEAAPTAAKFGGARTLLTVPMLKENALVGAIAIYRQEVRPFTDKQIELVQNFAAQAVIAIENTRLLNELRESLQQQTATADVLRVISSSPGELQPVFEAMLESATRICEANFGGMFRLENGAVRMVTRIRVPERLSEFLQRHRDSPGPLHPWSRLIQSRRTLHIADYSNDRAYLERDPVAIAGVELGGIRTLLAVPMLKDDELVGFVTIFRQEVRPFTDKQIELVSNFANQAVIAIENARLLNELRQRALHWSSRRRRRRCCRSSAHRPANWSRCSERCCKTQSESARPGFGQMFLCEGNNVRLAATIGVPKALVEFDKQRGTFQPTPGGGLEGIMRTKQVVHIADLN